MVVQGNGKAWHASLSSSPTEANPPTLFIDGEGLAMPDDHSAFHPAAWLFPLLQGDDFYALVDDIRLNGLREPIWLHRDGRIIDGRNRYRACQAAGVACPTRTFQGDDSEVLRFVVSANLHRRHLDASQRSLIAAQLATLRDGQRKPASPKGEPSPMTQGEAAVLMNVSKRSVERARLVLDSGDLSLIAAVRRGELPVSTAAEIAKYATPEMHARADKVFRQQERAKRIAREQRRRNYIESCLEITRARKIEEARAGEVDGVIPLPDAGRPANPQGATERRASYRKLYRSSVSSCRKSRCLPRKLSGWSLRDIAMPISRMRSGARTGL